jgi:hypothetical protein
MKLVRTTLLSAAGVIVAFGLTAAQAQSPQGSDVSPGGPPAAAPETSSGGTMGDPQGAAGAGPTTPEGGTAEKPGKAVGQTDQGEGGEPGSDEGKAAESKSAKDTMPSDDKAAEKPSSPEGKTSGKSTAEEPSATGKTEGSAESGEGKTGTSAKGETDARAKGETDATAKGESRKSGASAKIEPQQVQKVKTYFSSHRPSVKRVDRTEVSVSVGIALPGTIALYDLPPDIIVVEGGCPIKYFVWGEDVVLVDSCTRHVIEIIVGVA